MPISWVEVLEVVQMLDAQVLVCQSVGLKCWKFYGCCMHRYLYAISWVEVLEVLWMLDAQVLVCLSVGLKCWKSYGCWMNRY